MTIGLAGIRKAYLVNMHVAMMQQALSTMIG
jgi:hypothetical protein